MRKIALLSAGTALAIAGLGSSISSAKLTHTTAASCPANPIQFAVEPYDTGPNLEKAYASLVKDLSAKLGCTIKLTVSNSYVAEIEAMRGGQLQMGEFGPLGYVLAHKIADAQPVAAFGDKNGKPDTYTAGIWVSKSSSITSLKQLTGKTLALSSTTSTSGGLYPISALVKAGFKCTVTNCSGLTIHFTGSHTDDLLALTHGTVDAAEINSQQEAVGIASKQFDPSKFREIWTSTAIINDPICVYGKLGPAFAKEVQTALLSLSAKQVSVVDTELGTASNGPMVKATDGLYNQVRAVANAVHLTTADL